MGLWNFSFIVLLVTVTWNAENEYCVSINQRGDHKQISSCMRSWFTVLLIFIRILTETHEDRCCDESRLVRQGKVTISLIVLVCNICCSSFLSIVPLFISIEQHRLCTSTLSLYASVGCLWSAATFYLLFGVWSFFAVLCKGCTFWMAKSWSGWSCVVQWPLACNV